jgi:hypothetical protein
MTTLRVQAPYCPAFSTLTPPHIALRTTVYHGTVVSSSPMAPIRQVLQGRAANTDIHYHANVLPIDSVLWIASCDAYRQHARDYMKTPSTSC